MRPGVVKAVLLVACGSSVYLYPAAGQLCPLTQHQMLNLSDAGLSEDLGFSLSVSGDRFVTGNPDRDVPLLNNGGVFLYRRQNNGTPSDPSDDFWVLEIELNGWGGWAGGMGSAVSLDDVRMVAGAYANDAGCPEDPSGCFSGAAYVYFYRTDIAPRWEAEQILLASDNERNLGFGISVAIKGKWIAVGQVPDSNHDSTPATGAVYLFRADESGPSVLADWIEHVKITTPQGATEDRFGTSVVMTDERLFVGAPSFSSGNNGDPGSAYVFRRQDNGTPADLTDDEWVFEAKLTASDGVSGDLFGFSLAADGDRVIVGAMWEDSGTGSAYVFRHDDNGTPSDSTDDFWFQEGKLNALDEEPADNLGFSVAISGDLAVVGAFFDNTEVGNERGSAAVFRYIGSSWIQEQKLIASNGNFSSEFGHSVALAGDQIIVGAMDDNQAGFDAGAVYVFNVFPDCNGNCLADEEDLASGLSPDCNANGLPDECEDCNGNGDADSCDIADGFSLDCNANGVPDACDVFFGPSPDCQPNFIPDECDILSGASLDCNLIALPDECELNNDCNGDGIPDDCAAVCALDCECHDRDVCTFDRCIAGVCASTPGLYGDVDHDGDVDLFDLFCVLSGFSGDFGACSFLDADIEPCAGNGTIDIFDLFAVLNAFSGDDPCCGG